MLRPSWLANFRQKCHLKFESKVERRFRTKKGNGGLVGISNKISFLCVLNFEN